MKKTRIIASLLCIMMIVCALPMMASAEVATQKDMGASIAEVMNTIGNTSRNVWARPLTDADTLTFAKCNLDFTDPAIAQDPYLTVLNNSVTFGENGATFGGTQGIMRYYPAAANKVENAGWSPVSESNFYTFSFKLNEGGTLSSRAICHNNYTEALVDLTTESVTITSGAGPGCGANATEDKDGNSLLTYTTPDYAPGTEWNDVLIYMSSTYNPYQVWMKKASSDTFVKIGEARYPANPANGKNPYNIGFGNDYTSTKKGITFIGTEANVGYAKGYKGVIAMPYASAEEILGGPVASTYSFDFDENSNFANSSGRTGFEADGYTSDANGLTLVDPADTSSLFTFKPFGSYSPLHGSTNWNPTAADYVPQAVYLKAKGNFHFLTAGPRTYGKIDMQAKVGAKLQPTADACFAADNYYVQDEWTEYLIVPNQRTEGAYNVATGYSIYVKDETSTNGKWWKIVDQKFQASASAHTSWGLSFKNITGHIKNAKILSLSKNVADAAAIPANANYLYFNENYDAETSYANVTTQGVVKEDSTIVFPATKSSLDYIINGLEIPVGGYAEFKVKYDGIANYSLFDGQNHISIGQQSDYNTISSSYNFTGANNTTWRIWRVVRTADGYSLYVKSDTDTGWVQLSNNIAGGNSSSAPMVKFNFGVRNGGGVGDSKIDYFKVYGPAPESALTVTDGYTASPVVDGATLTYPASLRAIATPEAGKLLVVSYKGDDMAKAQIIKVEDMVNDSVIVNATADGATKIKVFLWDNFNGLNKLAPAMTFGL